MDGNNINDERASGRPGRGDRELRLQMRTPVYVRDAARMKGQWDAVGLCSLVWERHSFQGVSYRPLSILERLPQSEYFQPIASKLLRVRPELRGWFPEQHLTA